MSDGAGANEWAGERGRIDARFLQKTTAELLDPAYSVVGPPPMVQAMRKMLNEAGVDDDDVRTEEFYGY